MGRSKLDSINEFARQGYLVRVTCHECGNVSDWNPVELGFVDKGQPQQC